MRRARALLFLVLLVPLAGAEPRLAAVVPDLPGPGPGDEGFALSDPDGANDASGWILDDDETRWVVPAGTVLDAEPTWFTADAALWHAFGGPPGIAYPASALRLANDGETLRLLRPDGSEADRFTWGPGGDVVSRSPGLVYEQTADGWATPRPARIGQSDAPLAWTTASEATLFLLPDHGYGLWRDLISGAHERIQVHAYHLDHPEVLGWLAQAAGRGVDVQVLVEGDVVGRGADQEARELDALADLVASGGDVRLVSGGRYDFHHLKVLVADGELVVQTENVRASALPADPSWGSRGWGVTVRGPVVDIVAAWLAVDYAAWDVEVVPSSGRPPTTIQLTLPESGRYTAVTAPAAFAGAIPVLPVLSPDHTAAPASDPLLSALASARERIWTQQLRISDRETNMVGWERTDRLTDALIQAHARGVDVRVHVAWDRGNEDMQAAQARLRAAGVQVQTWDDAELNLHSKTWIIDEQVWIGSMNGNHASRSLNRELSILIDSPAVAAQAADWFRMDWRRAGSTAPLPAAGWPMLFAAIGVAALLGRR